MLHNTKLLMRRLAYVPWLLAAGLVLGWAGEAVANTDTTTPGHATGDHTHATDPNMVVTYDLQAAGAGTAHSITVTWSMSRSRGFGTSADNGDPATNYMVSLHSGEIPDEY